MNDDLDIRIQKANAEWREVIDWSISEEDKVAEQLREEGAVIGLDGHKERFRYIYDEVRRRTKEIIHKYDLPNKDKRS